MMSARHFLSLMDCTPEELVSVIRRGIEAIPELRLAHQLYNIVFRFHAFNSPQ